MAANIIPNEKKNNKDKELNQEITDLTQVTQLAHLGHVIAQYNLGCKYANGEGVDKNETIACGWFSKAAKQGDATAQYNLGIMYAYGRGVTKDEKIACEYFMLAAKQGDSDAQYNFAYMCIEGLGVKKDYKKGREWYELAAKNGHDRAQFNLAWMLENGEGGDVDYKSACIWYQKAASQKIIRALYHLGGIFERGGNGIDRNINLAIQLWTKAAQHEDTYALYEMAERYFAGNGVGEDKKTAIEYFQKAASQGHLMAQFKLATLYLDGIGLPQNQKLAVEWYQKAAEQQNREGSNPINYSDIHFGNLLGKGSYGSVYQAKWNNFDIAAKKLLIKKSKDVRIFEIDFQIMAQLRCPNIVQFYGFCDSPEYCIFMEYMPKGSLFNLLHSKTTLDWKLRLQIARDMACGLAFLHNKNIIHRDLKSANVLLDSEMKAKLTDIGLSKIRDSKVISDQVQKEVGNLQWMAPEVFSQSICTKASDIFSLGVTFWELVTQKIPFQHVENLALIPLRVGAGRREDIPGDCPKRFSTLITQCWHALPEERPSAECVIEYFDSNHENFTEFLSLYKNRLALSKANTKNIETNSLFKKNDF